MRALLTRLALGALLWLAALGAAQAAEDPEEKVYKQAYSEVKSAFDDTRAKFDAVYGPIKEAQAAITEWRGAVRRAQSKAAIEKIEGMLASGTTLARDEMVRQMLGEDALKALQKLDKITGKTIGLPEPKRMLDLIRDPDDFAKRYGYMYNLSIYERAFRDSSAAKALAQAEAIFEKGGKYLDKAGQLVDFVALFDPNNNAADGPVGRLKSLSAVLTYMQDITGPIPGLDDLVGFYAEAATAFAGALDRLDMKLKEARAGSLCGQLGQLQAELAALDQHIKGGSCALYLTDYGAEATLKPLKVWEHFEYGETFYWRPADGASAYLSRADAATLLGAFRALRASEEPQNAARATPDTFLSRAMVTTRAGRIIAERECRAGADLIASDRFRATLLALGVIDYGDAIAAPSGTRLRPGRTPAAELLGLCLFDPSARNLIFDLVARYRDIAPIRLALVSADWRRPEAPRAPVITVNGTRLVDGKAGTRFDPPAARIFGARTLADLGAPVVVEIRAKGFLPKTVELPLSPAQNYAKIGLTPEPEEEDAAEKAKAEAEARAAAAEQALKEARAAEAQAREEAKAREEAARVQEARAEELAQAAAEAAAQAAAEAAKTGKAPTPVAPTPIPPAPDPVWVATGQPAPTDAAPSTTGEATSSAGQGAETPEPETAPEPEIPQTLPPDPQVAIGTGPGDSAPLGTAPQPGAEEQPAPESTAPPPDSEAAAIAAVGEAAPGLGTQVPLAGLPGQVMLGDQVVVSVNWTEPAPTAASPGTCAPGTPFTECEVEIGNTAASVTVHAADDTEDLVDPGPAPAALTFIWQGSEGVRFDPPSGPSPQTTVRFERPGEAKIWAQILREGTTIAEGSQQIVTVGLPSLALAFDPPGGAKPGAEITARIVTTPPLAEDLFTVTWAEPPSSNRLELDGPGATIRFTGAAEEVIALEARLTTPFWGDEIGTIKGSYSLAGGAIEVTAEAKGPAPQIWDPVAGGLVAAPAGSWLTGQEITLTATFPESPAKAPNWDWTVNPGTTLSNPISQTPTVSRAEPGAIEAEVVAHDADGRELGRGAITLSVAPQIAAMVVPDAGGEVPILSLPETKAGPEAAAKSSAPAPEVAPAPAACAPGQPAAETAASLWKKGLSAVSTGQGAEGLAALEASLDLCPDATRAAQVAALKTHLSAAPAPNAAPNAAPGATPGAAGAACAPGGADYARAAEHWRAGLAAVSGGAPEAGLAELDGALALCPDPTRAAQLAALKTRLAAPAPATAPETAPTRAPSALEAAAAAAQAACAPGGARQEAAQAALGRASRALDDSDLATALGALEEAQSLCPDGEKASLIKELQSVITEVEESRPAPEEGAAPETASPGVLFPGGAAPTPVPVPAPVPTPAPTPTPAPAAGVEGGYSGTITGAPGAMISLTISGGRVEGWVRGSFEGDKISLAFSGPAPGGAFDVPITGKITDSSYHMDWTIGGRITGEARGDRVSGRWTVGSDSESRSGSYQANRE